ncbi:hypothetical protein PG991_000995 [Apiospora marii]|uniref:Rhodopsin domain-containing protein n=1 Tax=Apiospora marii TaxID=335849 RepID=A0ABR1STK9_9PEZI
MFLSRRLAIAGNDAGPPVIQTDFIPPSEQGVKLLVINSVLMVLTAIWTALWFWCRKMKGAGYFVEDWMHLGALICFYGNLVCNNLGVLIGGAGHHLWELQPWHIVRLSVVAYSAQVFYAISMGLVKMSIVWMLQRIFITPAFALAAKAVMAFSVAWTILTILMGMLICQPVEMNWNPFTPGGRCGNQLAGFVAVGIIDVVNEFCILLLPMPMVWWLQMPLRYKAAVFCMFGVGVLTLIFAAVRVYEMAHVDFTDVSYAAIDATIYADVEPGVAIIVSCSPILRPLFDRVFGRATPTDPKRDWRRPDGDN